MFVFNIVRLLPQYYSVALEKSAGPFYHYGVFCHYRALLSLLATRGHGSGVTQLFQGAYTGREKLYFLTLNPSMIPEKTKEKQSSETATNSETSPITKTNSTQLETEAVTDPEHRELDEEAATPRGDRETGGDEVLNSSQRSLHRADLFADDSLRFSGMLI